MVLVDALRLYPQAPAGRRELCHMWSTEPGQRGLEELHALARQLGLGPEWFEDKTVLIHYDLTPEKRAQALACGAHEMGDWDWTTGTLKDAP